MEHRLIPLEMLGLSYVTDLHSATHLGIRKLLQLLQATQLRFPNQRRHIHHLIDCCKGCQAMKPGKGEPLHTGIRVQGRAPGRSWEIDFTEVKPGKYGYKYLLVMVDSFLGWVEAFPTKREMAQIVAKTLLEEIIPWSSQDTRLRQWSGFH